MRYTNSTPWHCRPAFECDSYTDNRVCPRSKLNKSRKSVFQEKVQATSFLQCGTPAPLVFPATKRTLKSVGGYFHQATCRRIFDSSQNFQDGGLCTILLGSLLTTFFVRIGLPASCESLKLHRQVGRRRSVFAVERGEGTDEYCNFLQARHQARSDLSPRVVLWVSFTVLPPGTSSERRPEDVEMMRLLDTSYKTLVV